MNGLELLSSLLPVDWSAAQTKACRYSPTRTDWWQVQQTHGGATYTLIGEDTDGDGVVDFIHADTTGSGRIDFSAFLDGDRWMMTNLVEAWFQVSFSLPWARNAYIPHSVDIIFNSVVIATFRDTLPEGHYSFPIPPRAISFPGDSRQGNQLEVKSEHLRGGHYVVTSDFQVVYRLTVVDTFVIAESREAAERKVYEAPGFRFRGADLSIDATGLSLSKTRDIVPGERIEVRANVHNLGMDASGEVDVALIQSLPGGASPLELARVTLPQVALYGPTPVFFPWVAVPGEHTLRVVIDPDKKLAEPTRFNNEALLTVRVAGKDIPPQLEIESPAEGQVVDGPLVPLRARAIDESGILLMELSVDGGVWRTRKGTDCLDEQVTVPAGEHVIHVRATDCSGNSVTDSRKVTVTYQPPVVALVEPAEGARLPAGRISARVRVERPEEVGALRASIGGGAWQELAPVSQEECVFELAAEPGRQELEIRVLDRAGVETTVSRLVEIIQEPESDRGL